MNYITASLRSWRRREGQQGQSIDPLRPTKAAVLQFPINAYSSRFNARSLSTIARASSASGRHQSRTSNP